MPLACLDQAVCYGHFEQAIYLHSNWGRGCPSVAINYLNLVSPKKSKSGVVEEMPANRYAFNLSPFRVEVLDLIPRDRFENSLVLMKGFAGTRRRSAFATLTVLVQHGFAERRKAGKFWEYRRLK